MALAIASSPPDMDVTVHGLHARTLSEAAIRTRAAHEAIRRPTGQRPKGTLDAATFIAATILRVHIGRTAFATLGSQPPPSVPNDISFTEDELLCIVFWIPPRRYVLTATTDGRINYLGSTD
jgi:hypothetical protein